MKSKKEAKTPQKATKASPVDSKPSKKPKPTPPGNYHSFQQPMSERVIVTTSIPFPAQSMVCHVPNTVDLQL